MNDSLKLLPDFMSQLDSQFTYEELFMMIQKLGVAILVGVLIGIERERSFSDNKKSFAGIRTFPFVAIFGFLGAFISTFTHFTIYLTFFVVFSVLVISSYVQSAKEGKIGITTEISSMLVFICGSLIYWNYIRLAAIIAVVLALFLSLKIQLHTFVETVSDEDITAVLKLGIVTIIILPLLPDKYFGPYETFNLRVLWYMVIFVAALSFVGYILTKYVGVKKGISLTSIFGGLVSSTALTYSFAKRSKISQTVSSNLAAGIIIASTIVYPKVFFEILVVNKNLLPHIWLQLLLIMISGVVFSAFLWEKSKQEEIGEITLKNPFELKSALLFGLIFGAILFLSKFSQIYLGEGGSYLLSVIAGLTNIDAITLSMAQLAGKEISNEVAANSIIFAALSNVIFKASVVIFIASEPLKKIALKGFGALAATAAIILIYSILL